MHLLSVMITILLTRGPRVFPARQKDERNAQSLTVGAQRDDSSLGRQRAESTESAQGTTCRELPNRVDESANGEVMRKEAP